MDDLNSSCIEQVINLSMEERSLNSLMKRQIMRMLLPMVMMPPESVRWKKSSFTLG